MLLAGNGGAGPNTATVNETLILAYQATHVLTTCDAAALHLTIDDGAIVGFSDDTDIFVVVGSHTAVSDDEVAHHTAAFTLVTAIQRFE